MSPETQNHAPGENLPGGWALQEPGFHALTENIGEVRITDDRSWMIHRSVTDLELFLFTDLRHPDDPDRRAVYACDLRHPDDPIRAIIDHLLACPCEPETSGGTGNVS